MRVLWITNIPVAEHRTILGLPLSQSGGWIESAYQSIKDQDDLVLGLVTTYNGDTILEGTDGHNRFYVLPCFGDRTKDISDSPKNQYYWMKVIEEFRPNIIQLWGTEFSHGLCALKVAKDIPSVVYIQGVMKELYHHYFDGMNVSERLMSTTLRSLIKKEDYWSSRRKYGKRAQIEQSIVEYSKNIIVENDWCASHYRSIVPGCNVFKSLLPVNNVFKQYQWTPKTMEPHTIFTTAGTNTIKGHHILLKALSIIKESYPDVMVYEPGENYYFEKSFRRRLMRDSYINYLLRLENKLGLERNVVRLGRLTPERMGEQMQKCNVFVMPSVIENHSSTLIEAMMVGAPCVSSYVGGISDYLIDGENGFFYRSDEPEMLAYRVMELFANQDVCSKISREARLSTINSRSSSNLSTDFKSIYEEIAR